MHRTPNPAVQATAARLEDVDAGMLVIPVFEEDDLADLPGLDGAAAGEIARARTSGEYKAKLYDLFVARLDGWRAPRVALVGAGSRKDCSLERERRIACAGGMAARQRRVARVAFVPRGPSGVADGVQAAAEGLTLANFIPSFYKTADRDTAVLEQTAIIVAERDLAAAGPAAARGAVLGACSNLSRDLCNEPGNILTPSVFAERAAEAAGEVGLAIDVLDERRIAELKMGLLLGVARGSAEPPRVIVLRHDPSGAQAAPVLGLVGKGITFDTGGISIKPADGMERMKDDMAGGAAVICAMRAIASLGAPIRVVGVIPTTENMPGGRAIKPGDVLTSASGKTVEVLNTDAEGRLILGDGLWYARQLGATHLVNVATLTGACVIALGRHASGLFGRPDSWVERVREVANRAGDRVWPMPVFEEYFEQIRSDIADVANSGGRPAGAITAALFLKEFAGDLPWVHMDIAGTAWSDDARPYQPKGPTGVGVRALADLAFTSDRWNQNR